MYNSIEWGQWDSAYTHKKKKIKILHPFKEADVSKAFGKDEYFILLE